MLLRKSGQNVRKGAAIVEAAFVYPVVFLLVMAMLLLSMVVFRYHQVAHVAREGSRWASVHGALYAKENGVAAATPTDVYTNAISPPAAGLPGDGLSYSVTWNTDSGGNPVKSPTSSVLVTNTTTGQQSYVSVRNTVAVRVTYVWDTGFFGVITLSSTSVNIISY